ncbi:hypothetical protein AM501_06145 [Aneurinibacillus migulanus]|uniref:Uncharacterized protein n=1 Tax=Aneurinibacillus migulanus TaxID=47500 RepID=A0A0D1Y3R8_ANEMI|nr:hypothetical protein [Aneurinibacillus migulanus]KIV50942.1 hypothetical protein TS64_25630 [Aneurinibacillus migulanus]KIV58993.1 hypothetical protein TS65_03385 [Aneurinibacillus migulanus]KON99304.1 hypothetical protein AF333_00795 [Aneurinibacillus migulanus]KPD09085.1 hypothetical protein AM501_06145 [Aneurinibacillus migulanus]MCP1354988.1 hypothetical protein [Aneurinibacillus migulanus]
MAETDCIKKEFMYALFALSLTKDKQIQYNSPGCISCDLIEDFLLYSRLYEEKMQGKLNHDVLNAINSVREGIDELDMHDCFDNDDLDKAEWESVREISKKALIILGINNMDLPAYVEIGNGVWVKEDYRDTNM